MMGRYEGCSELELIATLTRGAPSKAAGLVQGVGDDCAVLEVDGGDDWLITTDALIEGVHFRRSFTDLKGLGMKALAVNLSDIAAMGGAVRFYTMSIGLSDDCARSDAGLIALGMREVEGITGAKLIGGDTCLSRAGLVISVTAIGSVPKGRAIMRSGAKAPDAIYATGSFGGAALGLVCLERESIDPRAAPFISRHRLPPIRLDVAKWLMGTEMVTSMIDVSDGLAADLTRIAGASGVGFELDEGAVRADVGFEELAADLGLDVTETKLAGGEDYELVFTVDGNRIDLFEELLASRPEGSVPIARIGVVVDDRARHLIRGADGSEVKLARSGFDHFVL